MRKKKVLAMVTALSMGLSHLTMLGVFSAGTAGHAQTSATVEVTSDFYEAVFDPVSYEYFLEELLQIPLEPFPLPATGGELPNDPNRKTPEQIAKDCAEKKLRELSVPGNGFPVKSLTDALKSVRVEPSKVPENVCKAVFNHNQQSSAAWDSLSEDQKNCLRLMPMYACIDGRTTIYLPEDQNGIPALFADQGALNVFMNAYGVTQSITQSWNSFLGSLGFPNMAASLSEGDSREWFLFHELAHVQSNGFTHPDGRRDETTLFSGNPPTTDDLATANLAAAQANRPGSPTYNTTLQNLANSAGANGTGAFAPTSVDC